MAGNQSAVEHVEINEPAHDVVSGSNSPESICFEKSKLNHPAHHSQLSASVATSPFAEHGALIDHDIHPQADTVEAHPGLRWSIVRHICQDAFSEFFGVFILILFGNGAVAQIVLSSEQKGDYQSISWGEFHHLSIPSLLCCNCEPDEQLANNLLQAGGTSLELPSHFHTNSTPRITC